jgi:hypothetical protein
MTIHELDTTSPNPPSPTTPPTTLLLSEFLNSTVNDDNKNVICRMVGLNENQIVNIQYCQNGEITPYIENFHRSLNNDFELEPLVQEAEEEPRESIENTNQLDVESSETDEDDSTVVRPEATSQEELNVREYDLILEENEANRLEVELTTREHMLEISPSAREVLIERREYEVTRRLRFLKLRGKFIKDHEDQQDFQGDFRGVG